MKIRHSRLIGLIGALAVSLAITAASAVAAETPFKGTVNAVETGTTVGPTRFLVRNGGGNATHLGKYTEHITMQINLPTRHSMGAATFTAANGDTLTATVEGQATPASPGVLSIVEIYTITGGTGRFADATGTFTLNSTVVQVTGVSTGKFSGAIDHQVPQSEGALGVTEGGDTIPLGARMLRVVEVRDDDADQPPRLVVEDVAV